MFLSTTMTAEQLFFQYWKEICFFSFCGMLCFSGSRQVLMAISKGLLKTFGIRSHYDPLGGKLRVEHDEFQKGEVQRIKEVAASSAQNIGTYGMHTEQKLKPLTKVEKRERKNNKKK